MLPAITSLGRRGSPWALLFLSVALGGGPPTAWADVAQAVESQRAEQSNEHAYRALVDEGLREYQSGHFEEARALFARAHDLSPNARTLRGMALVSFELRRYVECVEYAEDALGSQAKPLTEEMRGEMSALVERARHLIARVAVEVAPADAELRVDGILRAGTGSRSLLLQLGEHVLELSKTGFGLERRALHINGGEELEMRVVLVALPSAAAVPVPRAAVERPGDGARRDDRMRAAWYQKPWVWAIVGVVAAGAVAGGVLGARAREAKTEAPFVGNLGSTEGP